MHHRHYDCETSLSRLIINEIAATSAALRKNAKWSTASSASVLSSALLSDYGQAHARDAFADVRAEGSVPRIRRTRKSHAHQDKQSHVTELDRQQQPPTSLGITSEPLERVSSAASSSGPKVATSSAAPFGPNLFAELQLELREVDDIANLDAHTLLWPFLEVIRSGDTSGPITAAALSAVDKFITYGLIHVESPSVEWAMQDLSAAATHCKFEASDAVGDEIVLAKILQVLKNALTSDIGRVLTDEAVCEMMETGLSMCCQMRLSEMLRKSAENTMQGLVAAVFTRLQAISSTDEQSHPALSVTVSRQSESSTNESSPDIPFSNMKESKESKSIEVLSISRPDPNSESIPAASSTSTNATPIATQTAHFAPSTGPPPYEQDPSSRTYSDRTNSKQYGLPCIRELLRVVISLLDPHDAQHTDSMRLLALNILTTAFEIGGRSIGRFPALRAMVSDKLCKHLFQLATSDNTPILGPCLRMIALVFDTMGEHLRLQQELYISFILDRLVRVSGKDAERELDRQTWDAPLHSGDASQAKEANGLLSPGNGLNRDATASPNPQSNPKAHLKQQYTNHLTSEGRTLLLEQLCIFARQPATGPILWTNYDCSMESEDLWERLVRFYCRGVYPNVQQQLHQTPLSQSQNSFSKHSASPDGFQLLSLDTILTFIEHMFNRMSDISFSLDAPSMDPKVVEFQRTKAQKALLLEGAQQFNAKPKNGIKFLETNGLLKQQGEETQAEALARFLKTCPRIDKRVLGDFISRPDQIDVLKAYLKLFDFKDKIISDAMRDLLESFRLPGEAQQIDRITDHFAEAYYNVQSDKMIRSRDAVYVLSFSIIMLNTDQHNPQNIKNRMKLDDYRRNLRGVNDKEDFPPEYLKAIYDDIRKREIVLPEEHQGQLGFEYAWRELIKRSKTAGPLKITLDAVFDAQLFGVAWRPMITALSYAFANFEDEFMAQRCITAYRQCASLASRYDLPEIYDYTISSLARNTGLWPLPNIPSSGLFPKVSVPAKESEKAQDITISPLSIRFGHDTKAQLAAIVLFSVASSNAAGIRHGWTQICQIYQTLFLHALLPAELLNFDDFRMGIAMIPLKPKESAQPKEERRSDGGLLSTLSSYLLSPYGPAGQDGLGRDLNEDDIDSTLCAVDCIASCRLDQMYLNMLRLPKEILVNLIESLTDLLDQATLQRVLVNDQTQTLSAAKVILPYEPSSMFLLELGVSMTCSAPQAISDTSPTVLATLDKLLAGADQYSPLLIERVIVGTLRLVSASSAVPKSSDMLRNALTSLQALPPHIINTTAEQLASNIIRVVSLHPDLLATPSDWERALSFLARTAENEVAAKASFTFAQNLVYENRAGGVQADNFGSVISVLSAFAIIAGQKDMPSDPSLSQDAVIERGRRALDTIRDAQNAIGPLASGASMSFAKTWEIFWFPVLSAYAQHCVNAKRDIRQTALSHLQRTLMAHEMLSNPELNLSLVFDRIVFPVLDELLKPQVFRRDPEGMGETRLRAVALLCKIFLHCATQRHGMSGLLNIWIRVLDMLDRMMHSGRRDAMYEAVPEQLKNAILVMAAQQILIPPSEQQTPEQAELWDKTFTRINTFLPTLQVDLFGQGGLQPPEIRSARSSRPASPAPQIEQSTPEDGPKQAEAEV